jgi:iron-sulfur cluster assembly protein
MLMLTHDAAEAIKGLAATPGAAGLRIAPAQQSPNGSEPSLQVELATRPDARDQVLEAEGARLFLAPSAADALSDKVLDADIESGQVTFAVLQQSEE